MNDSVHSGKLVFKVGVYSGFFPVMIQALDWVPSTAQRAIRRKRKWGRGMS